MLSSFFFFVHMVVAYLPLLLLLLLVVVGGTFDVCGEVPAAHHIGEGGGLPLAHSFLGSVHSSTK